MRPLGVSIAILIWKKGTSRGGCVIRHIMPRCDASAVLFCAVRNILHTPGGPRTLKWVPLQGVQCNLSKVCSNLWLTAQNDLLACCDYETYQNDMDCPCAFCHAWHVR